MADQIFSQQAKLIQRVVMKNTKDEMLRDIITGEASLASFEEKGSITFEGLLEKLDAIVSSSESEDRVRAAGMAITRLKSDMAARCASDGNDDEHSVYSSRDPDETPRS